MVLRKVGGIRGKGANSAKKCALIIFPDYSYMQGRNVKIYAIFCSLVPVFSDDVLVAVFMFRFLAEIAFSPK